MSSMLKAQPTAPALAAVPAAHGGNVYVGPSLASSLLRVVTALAGAH
jgi:hypothetical protein